MAPDPYECKVCEQTYNNENRRPLVLPCTHSFCQRCLQGVKASTNPVCPFCRYDLSRSSIKDFVFCHQLVPDEEEIAVKRADKNKTEKTKEKVRNVCKQHEDLEYLFWCLNCNCPACKMCLHKMHKNCDWVVLDDHVRNLGQKIGACQQAYSEQVRQMHRAGFDNRRQLETVKRAIGNLKGLEEQLEMYYGLLASVYGDAEDCLDELDKCQKDAVSGAVDPLVLLKLQVEITAKLKDLLRMPDQPDMPLLHLLENYEASVNMALQPEAKRTKLEFPKTLADFGYCFRDGKLQNVDTGEGFNFVVKANNHAYNQAHYEALGEVMDEHVYGLLTREGGLKRVPVPIESRDNPPGSFIFASDNWKTCNRLMILIHGSGVVRAGQWARRLIINDSLNSGTQLPYIHRAKSEGYGVLVLNTNNNRAVDDSGRTWPIKGSEDPTRHADTVWRQYVLQSGADHIAIVAHSYGGCVATHLFTQFTNDFNKRVFAVALTDSVHMINNAEKFHGFMKLSRNWVTSNQPLDTDLSHNRPRDVPTVSAGVTAHEMTSWGGFNSVFEFFSNRYYDKTNERIPTVSEEDYLFYPPSPAVRQSLRQERGESLPSSGQAVANHSARPTSEASNQGAVGGGDHDDDGQDQSKEEELPPRHRGEKQRERKDHESASDGGRPHRNDRLDEGQDDYENRRQNREEVHKEEDQENVSGRERHHHRKGKREKGERDGEKARDRDGHRRHREGRRGEKEDSNNISDEKERDDDEEEIERRREERRLEKQDQKIISEKEERDDDGEKTESRHRRREERRGENEKQEIISGKEERNYDEEKAERRRRRRKERRGEDEDQEIISGKEERDDDEEKAERRRRRREERRREKPDQKMISDSERNHHSNDGLEEKRQTDREGLNSEHSHHSNKGKDQDSDHSHYRSDKRRSVDRRHGHEASSDSGHSSQLLQRRRSSRNHRQDDEDGNGAEGDNEESNNRRHKTPDREGKKDTSSDDDERQWNEQKGRGSNTEDDQDGCRGSEHREKGRSRRTADPDQEQDESHEGDEGSDAESSGDDEGAGGKNDITVNQSRSGGEDESGHEGKSADEHMSGDDGKSGDEGASCEEYLTPDGMDQDNRSAKPAPGGLAIQNGSADKHGQPAAKDRAIEDDASEDGQGVSVKTKRAEPAEDDTPRHRSGSGASNRGDKEGKSVRSKRQT